MIRLLTAAEQMFVENRWFILYDIYRVKFCIVMQEGFDNAWECKCPPGKESV
jgi:hypothetical protein